MRKQLRSLLCCTIALGLGSTALAATATAKPSNIPVVKEGFGLNLQALYLQPDANNLNYAVYTQPLPAPAPHWKQKNINPDYHFGFNLGAIYTFAGGHNQVQLNWMHLHTSDSDSASATGSASVAPPYYFGPLAQALFNSGATGKVKFDVDSLNLVADHLFNLGRYVQLAPFVGLGSAYLKQKLTANFTGENSSGDAYNITSYNTSKYLGVGPRLGLTTTAYVSHHFGIVAEVATSLLVGSMKSETSFLSQGRDNPTAVSTDLADESSTQLVPELDGKLGLTFNETFHSGCSLAIQAGYMLGTYFNGIKQVEPTALVPNQFNNGVIAIESSSQNQYNLDLNGPYAQLTLLF